VTPERLAELRLARIFYADNASGDTAIICELLAHIDTLEGFKREALAARNILDWRGKNIVSFNPEVAQAEHLIYRAARAANTPERTTQHEE